jgi:hypothetical protein
MDFSKLKLDQFTTYRGYNLPESFHVDLTEDDHPEVYFLFCTSFEELNRWINHVLNNQTHKNNRLYIVYKKGQKHFHRDHIMMYVKKSPLLERKAPMLCSLSKEYSCITTQVKV